VLREILSRECVLYASSTEELVDKRFTSTQPNDQNQKG
jgi:hypothetical protein